MQLAFKTDASDTLVGMDGGHPTLLERIIAAFPERTFSYVNTPENTIEFFFHQDLTEEEQDQLTAVHDAWNPANLAIEKHEKCVTIDARTDEIMTVGFEFPADSGNIFSLTLEAQTRLLGVQLAGASFPYPLTWSLLDNSGVYSIPDQATFQSFFGTALTTMKNILAAGNDLKDEVNLCSSLEEIDAIVDTR
jgi:hypothetical protein